MKVLLVNGSPKANGNTARALAEVAEQLNAEGIDTEVFQLGAKPIRDCIGCGLCGKLGGRWGARSRRASQRQSRLPARRRR